MKKLLILQTSHAKNPAHIVASKELQKNYEIIVVNYPDIVGFDGPLLITRTQAKSLDDIDKIWLEFDWELADSHVNYHHITRLIIAKYADKLVVNKKTFQKYHPEYDDKLFIANVLQYAHLPHPETVLLSRDVRPSPSIRIVKKRFSGRARDVYLVRDTKDLPAEVLENARDYITQGYIDIAEEFRVVVFRDQIIAAVKKSSKFKGGVTGKVRIIDEQRALSGEQEAICLATARAVESELVGIDLAVDTTGESWIVEFNIGASLIRFQEVTGIDLVRILLLEV